MQRYNLPGNSIEIVIPGDYKPKQMKSAPSLPKKSPKSSPHTSPKKPLRYIASRSLFIVCGLATLGNIPVYSMISTPDATSSVLNLTEVESGSPAQVLQDLNLPAVASESFSGFAMDILPDAQQGNWKMRTLVEGDTLETALDALKLSKLAKPLLKDTAIAQELETLKPDAALLVQVVDDQLQQLIYTKGKNNAYIVSSTDNGFVGKWESDVFEIRESKIAFTVKHSIQRDGKEAGLSNSLIRQLGHVFRQDVDFKKGLRAGDKLGVIFEDYQYQGASIYTDKVLAAEYSHRETTKQRVRFTLEDGKTDYFSPNADTELKRTAFDRTPVAGGRMSSGFGMRRHPVFGFRKAHAGQDFAAPRGTPIHATADGQVKFLGRQGGYGNVVELRHINGITTLYGHMSGFKQGLGSGHSVKRGDVIGYVGSTGTSTGNHVHYEYRMNGVAQNPVSVDLPQVGIMSAKEMQQFKNHASAMIQQLTELRKVAAADAPAPKQNGG